MRYSDFTMHQINCMSFTSGTQAKIKRVQKKSNIYKRKAIYIRVWLKWS